MDVIAGTAAEGGWTKQSQRLLRHHWVRCLAMTGILFASSDAFLFSLEIPSRPEGYVSDYARLLLTPERTELEEMLRHFENETSNQVVVATFPSLEGESLEDFSIRLAKQWKIGQKGKDNGVILLIFKEDRKIRIEVGYGLEAVLPDATCRLIIENEITPRFREGRFYEGIKGGLEAVLQATRGEYAGRKKESDTSFFNALLFLVFVGYFLASFLPASIFWSLLLSGLLTFLSSPIFGFGLQTFLIFFLSASALSIFLHVYRNARCPAVLSKQGCRDWRRGRWKKGGLFDMESFWDPLLKGRWSMGGLSAAGGGGDSGGFGGGGGGFGGGGASGGW